MLALIQWYTTPTTNMHSATRENSKGKHHHILYNNYDMQLVHKTSIITANCLAKPMMMKTKSRKLEIRKKGLEHSRICQINHGNYSRDIFKKIHLSNKTI